MKLVDILARELKEWPKFVVEISRHGGAWIHHGPSDPRFAPDFPHCNDLPDFSESVKRSEWQAAVDALKVGAQGWDGEGLPPVGLQVENKLHGPVMVLAHGVFRGGDVVICQGDDTIITCTPDTLSPIRTAEQIAADERESHVLGMLCHDALGNSRRGLAEALYDAGYRKQVQS